MTVQVVVFAVCAVIVLGGAFGVILSRNPVHAALSLVATLFGIAVLFLNQNAQLLAAVQVIVYTGAIVVLILFVIMLLGVDRAEDIDVEPLVGQRTVGFVAALAIFCVLFGVFVLGGRNVVTGTRNCAPSLSGSPTTTMPSPFEPQCDPIDPNTAVVAERPNINQIGRVLFTDFVLPLEITAGLLTIAVVGAVVLARRPGRELEPMPDPEPLDDPTIDELQDGAAPPREGADR